MNLNSGSGHHDHHTHHSHRSPYSSNECLAKVPASRVGGNGMVYMEDPGQPPNACAHPMQQHGGGPHQMSVPSPSGWAKQPHQNLHHPMSGNGNCSPSSSVSSNYGASHNYLQQSFYSPDPHASADATTGRPTNYSNPTASSSPCAYYGVESRGTEYYHQHQHHQFSTFDPPVKGRRGGGGSSCSETASSHTNFYPGGNPNNTFYPLTQQSNHHYAEVGGEYSRMHYNSGGSSGGNTSGGGGCGAGDYFNGPATANNRPSSLCPSYGHHHVSTPLEFHHHQVHLQPQPFRRNSLESFTTNEPSETSYNQKYGYSGNSTAPAPGSCRVNPHLIKREPVIPPPPWSTEQSSCAEIQENEQYFFPSGNSATHPQYHRPPQSSSVQSHHRCDSHGTPTPPLVHPQQPSSCSFDESTGSYKKISGAKQRSQSLSFPRNYESSHHFRASLYQHQPPVPSSPLGIDPTKDVPVSNKAPPPGQGFGSESCSDRTSRGSFNRPSGQSMEISLSEHAQSEEEEDAGMDSDSSSTTSQKSSFTPMSADDGNQSEDNFRDLEELKKEIESVTTTTESSGDEERGSVGELQKEAVDQEVSGTDVRSGQGLPPKNNQLEINVEETELSNSSLTLFDSIALNTFDSPTLEAGEMEPVDNQSEENHLHDFEDQDSLSGLSSISSQEPRIRHHLSHSNSSTCGDERSRSPGPQKIMKRSFSEADKELVVNTTAITVAALEYSSRTIEVPKGWKRETLLSGTTPNAFIVYVSPSDTELRTLEEVKNYITSDGTCKCGLSCPLHLEHAFSFDPKVTNSREDEIIGSNAEKRRSCCNQKRKIPLSEDSPLISSTRDDLGDSGDGESLRRNQGAKKRRKESGEECTTLDVPTKEEEGKSSSLIVIPKSPVTSTPSTHYSQNVSVPFAQQSPDTTTQTPQRDMSPASSVSSDTSTALSSRSNSSTPTSVGVKTSPTGNSSLNTISGKAPASEFAWPIPPGNTSLVRPQTPPSGSSLSQSCTYTNRNAKKSSNYQHHLISKSPLKRSSSPCPNIDVRQIPTEKNHPPPRPGQATNPIISILPTGASHPIQNQNSGISLVPIPNVATSQGENQSNVTHLNTGYSISPVLPNQSTAPALQFTSIVPSTSYSQDSIGMPKLVNSSAPILSTGVQSLPSSITISVVGQEQPNSATSPGVLPKLVQKSNTNVTGNGSGSGESNSEKSPLQLVQDVVDRFQGEIVPESGTSTTEQLNNGKKEAETSNEESESQSLESKIMKIIADAASASAKTIAPSESTNCSSASVIQMPADPGKDSGIRCGMNLNMLPISSASTSSPVISSHVSIQSLPQMIFTSNAATLTTTSNSNPSNMPVMTSSSILGCGSGPLTGNPLGVNTSNTGISLNSGNQLILQPQADANNSGLRYPIFQTLQPIFLNPGGGNGPLLIPNANDPQSFIQIDQNNQGQQAGDLLHQTMVIDPASMSMCGNNLLANGPGPKKKKKRLSKKQQQQQAQLQLQQQLLLQQLFNHQQVQQQHVQQQQLPLLLPPSFNLGPQGFLQPMNMNMSMNFFPTPTVLTLPNLILNPADGTLFIQQAGPQLSSATPQPTPQIPPPMKISGVPIQAATQNNSSILIPPRKETLTLTQSSGGPILTTGEGMRSSGECGIDDSSRQNATPDSSTNDCQLGLTSSTGSHTPQVSAPLTVSLPLGSSTNLQSSKKGPLKSKVVSSSTATTVHKRILPQKQILPKIDSTTPSVENNN